jgi:hypothetical protein
MKRMLWLVLLAGLSCSEKPPTPEEPAAAPFPEEPVAEPEQAVQEAVEETAPAPAVQPRRTIAQARPPCAPSSPVEAPPALRRPPTPVVSGASAA